HVALVIITSRINQCGGMVRFRLFQPVTRIDMTPRLRNILNALVVWSSAVFSTATLLFLLLRRLGDTNGAAWASTFALTTASALVLSLAVGFLDTERRLD